MIRPFLAALAVCAGLGALPAHATDYKAAAAPAAEELVRKLKAGDSLCLLPGSYGPIAVQLLKLPSGQATFKACTPGTVTLAGLALYETQGLMVSGLNIDATKVAGVRCYGCVRVSFDKLKVTGVQPNAGITLDGGSQIAVTNSVVAGGHNGVNLGRGVDGWRVENFEVSGVTDGVFIANSPNGTINGLTCHDFAPLPGDHADCVQGTTKGGSQALANLVIEHVTFRRGAGEPAQGVFLADEGLKGYSNVQVRFACIIGGFDNGGYIENADAASSITDSVFIGLKDQRSSVYRVGAAQVQRVTANAFKFKLNSADTGDKTTPQVTTEPEAAKLCP